MQLDKVLRTMIRTKQEGKNDSYKAGFNDALALLDQEEKHIVFDEDIYRPKAMDKHPQVASHSSTSPGGKVLEKIVKETTQAFTRLEGEREASSLEGEEDHFPHIQTTPEPFTFNLKSQEQEEMLYNKENADQKENDVSQDEDSDKNSDETDGKDVGVYLQDDGEENVELDEAALMEQRQLEALAAARREEQEEDDDDDDE